MWDLRAALEVFQTTLVALSCFYFVTGAHFKQAEGHRRNRNPFIFVLIAILLSLLAEQYVLVVSTRRVPDLPPLAAAILYMLALVSQIDHLYPCTDEEKNTESAWNTYFGSWTAMFAFDITAIINPALTTRSLTLDLVFPRVRCFLELILLFVSVWPSIRLLKKGGTRLYDDPGNDTM
ncbi:hypothetical protein FSOLCH5_015357 [Fusarium solani]